MNNHFIWASALVLLCAYFGALFFGTEPAWAAATALGIHFWWMIVTFAIAQPKNNKENQREK